MPGLLDARRWVVTIIVCAVLAGSAAGQEGTGLAPWAGKGLATDTPGRHVEEVTKGEQRYTIVQGGTMDGRNCRSPMGVGMSNEGACEQSWESNRLVRMENVGESDVINPWVSNGRNNFRNLGEIVASAVEPGMTDREKCTAIYFQEVRHVYHFRGESKEVGDPVKVFNIYGYNTCGNDSHCLAGQWRHLGFKVAPVCAVAHCLCQVFYDGGWHAYDGDLHSMYLLRDNETVAGESDIVRDHDLVKRAHYLGILFPESRVANERGAALYVWEGRPYGERDSRRDTTMNMTLRPGEALTWRWGHLEPLKFRGRQAKYPDTICNGLWEYRPDLGKDVWRKGASSVEDIRSTPTGLAGEEGKTGTIVWRIHSPYVMVGGKLETEGEGAKFALSWDGQVWEDAEDNLDSFFAPDGPARYEFYVRCQLAGEARLRKVGLVNDLQMAFLALPEMAVGTNRFRYSDECPGDRKVRITHEWVERSVSRPPGAPAGAVSPPDGGKIDGTDIVFQWEPAVDPDGDGIADYQFELSEREDMRLPLSMNFYKLISRTKDKGKCQYALAAPGLLNPDRTYYWHVRAKDDQGVWGEWSKTWSFRARGPGYPLEVRVEYDGETGVGRLKWKANPVGRKPVKYRVYGSDEKGFTASDEAYAVYVGVSKEVSSPFPANLIAEANSTEMVVTGPGVPADAKRTCYTCYRVVAVDDRDKRSGPSEYAEGPRPLLYTQPVSVGKVGVPYHCELGANRSLGDLRARYVDGKETYSFWEIEHPVFALERGPGWLKLDGATGVLSGTPDAPGKTEVVVTVSIDREVRQLNPARLQWGGDRVLKTSTERVGSAARTFTIDVAP